MNNGKEGKQGNKVEKGRELPWPLAKFSLVPGTCDLFQMTVLPSCLGWWLYSSFSRFFLL